MRVRTEAKAGAEIRTGSIIRAQRETSKVRAKELFFLVKTLLIESIRGL